MSCSYTFERCAAVSPACWSGEHRALLARREQILQISTRVFGNRALGESWLSKPVLGLGHRIPCSLLANHLEYVQVEDFLCRLEHGVYT
ncbi:antitoxin Xre/MbcA/ParS toxin-binding domain-containing protein [Pseudomonas vranovensis]|uniref:antitoxin Xre/MbcA/ParS toxin-binding domain-containing protein n=1 Tax=Pseudomonas vranovensis TaxID=321661 RepID=UPI003CC91AD3